MKQGIFFFLWAASLLVSCASESGQQAALPYLTLEGQTMGTYYRVTYGDAQQRDFRTSLDSLLQAINLEVSTYIPEATISRFNQAEATFDLRTDPRSGQAGAYANRHFLPNFLKAKEVYAQTEGYFDPTVMPLVNYWGFGYTPKKSVEQADSAKVQELLLLVGFGQVELLVQGEDTLLQKARPGVQLDFSAIAKGYGVDEVGRFLAAQGIENFLVDIGGEALSRGRSPRGDAWRIGINRPQEDAAVDEIQVAVPLDNRAIATSGNYRNFYEVDGLKYSHTINPKTGFPERNTLLSASVFAPDCMTADAFATAFMTMGLERAFALSNQLPDIEAYFIYGLPDGGMATRYTPALAPLFEE